MGNTQDNSIDNDNQNNDQLNNFMAENKKFIVGDNTPFQFIQSSFYDYHPNKIKETSNLSNNLITKNIADYALNIYSDIITNNKKVNNAIYSPCTLMKFNTNGDKDYNDFFSNQEQYINASVEKFEVQQLKDINSNKSISSDKVDNDNEDITINESSHSSSKLKMPFSENKMIIKKKSEHELLLKQSDNYKRGLLMTPDVYISRNEVPNQSKLIQNLGHRKMKTDLVLNPFCLETPRKPSISNNKNNYDYNDNDDAKNKDIDKKYQHFIKSVISCIPPPLQEQPIHYKLKTECLNPQIAGKPLYTLILTETHKDNKQLIKQKNKPTNPIKCRKYFKSKREIEEEQIMKNYKTLRKPKAKSRHLKIDIRNIPTTNNALNDSSKLSNDNYNFFMQPESKRSQNKQDMPIKLTTHHSNYKLNHLITFSPNIEEKKGNNTKRKYSKAIIQSNNDLLDKKSHHSIKRRRTVEIIPFQNINTDLSTCITNPNKKHNKSLLSLPKKKSKCERSSNGLLMNFDNNMYKSNQLKKNNQKKYDEIIAKLGNIVVLLIIIINIPSYKIDRGPLDILNNAVDNNFNITEALELYKSRNRFLFECTEEEKKLEEVMKKP